MGIFDRMRGRSNDDNDKGSGSIAKNRLELLLVHDRINIAPEQMRAMKEEILAVISKYVPEIDDTSVTVALEQRDRYSNKLVAEIPFKRVRRTPTLDNLEESENSAFIDDDEPLFSDEAEEDETLAEAPAAVPEDDTPEVDVTDKDKS